MRIRPLLIGPTEMDAIEAAIAKAKANPVQFDPNAAVSADTVKLELKDRPKGYERPPSQFVQLPVGFTVAISFESQPAGLCRHLSVSVDEKGKEPNPYAVSMICEAFGFHSFPPDPGHIWLEEFEPGHNAVNVIQLEPT